MTADQASAAQLPTQEPTSSPSPEAAKYERGHSFYRQTFPSRKGSNTRWFPSTRYSEKELEEMAPLRARWNSNLHLQGLPHSAVAAVVASAVSPMPASTEATLNTHFLRCADSGTYAINTLAVVPPQLRVSIACQPDLSLSSAASSPTPPPPPPFQISLPLPVPPRRRRRRRPPLHSRSTPPSLPLSTPLSVSPVEPRLPSPQLILPVQVAPHSRRRNSPPPPHRLTDRPTDDRLLADAALAHRRRWLC